MEEGLGCLFAPDRKVPRVTIKGFRILEMKMYWRSPLISSMTARSFALDEAMDFRMDHDDVADECRFSTEADYTLTYLSLWEKGKRLEAESHNR